MKLQVVLTQEILLEENISSQSLLKESEVEIPAFSVVLQETNTHSPPSSLSLRLQVTFRKLVPCWALGTSPPLSSTTSAAAHWLLLSSYEDVNQSTGHSTSKVTD